MNKAQNSVITLIPIYKKIEKLLDYERVSIRNTINMLSVNYEIGFLTYSNDIFNSYCNFFVEDDVKIKLFEINKKHFQSIHTYNTLLKSAEFYSLFYEYKFLLIAQSDCYIFQTDLTPFFKYDYIGAPWFYDILRPKRKGLFCGNGGLSLRNVQKCYAVACSNKRLVSLMLIWNLVTPHLHKNHFLKRLYVSLREYFSNNRSLDNKCYYIFEDVYWSRVIPERFKYFHIPDGTEALKFSFETQPERCFELNYKQLPFGCHGFNKYNPTFWRNYISYK